MTLTTTDGKNFVAQNTFFVTDLTDADHTTIDSYAEHHAGGLVVLGRHIDPVWYVKAHDTWGPGTPEEPGDIVVHLYRVEDDEDGEDEEQVLYFTSGTAALAAFLNAEAPAEA